MQSPPSWGNELWLSPRQRRVISRLALLAAVLLAVSAVLAITPWPATLAIRWVFEQGGDAKAAAMQAYVPDVALTEHLDVEYGGDGADTSLDVFSPASADGPLPTVVWVHGGAWVSGSKEHVDPYLRILAAEGYTTVGVDYTVGPDAVYPTAVHQLNDALAFLDANAAEYGIDPGRIVLGGDSAGAQLASQLASLTTNPEYAALLGVDPALGADQLSGVVLECGVYDLRAMADLAGIESWGFKIALWAYTGTKDWSAGSPGAMMSTIGFVTGDFPPAFVSGGNGDALTWLQSIPFSRELAAAGVETDTLFWPADHEPRLPHEYQFELEREEAQEALVRTIAFLERVTAE